MPDTLGLGGTPPQPNYSSLFNDASQAYLSQGGSQANIDAYTRANPNQNYGQLASDAAQWYTDPNRSGAGAQDTQNQDVAGYFGIQAPPAGQNYTFPTQQSYGNGQDPTYSQSPTNPNQATLNQPPPNSALGPGFRDGNSQNQLGGQGSISAALQGPGEYYYAHQNDAGLAGANTGAYAPGSGVQGKDPWSASSYQVQQPNGSFQSLYRPGYGAGLNGEPIQWSDPAGPEPSLTQAGQQDLAQPINLTQPLQAGGQPFAGLQGLLDFMKTSSGPQQGIKQQMEQKDAQGGSLEPGEGNLFDQFARYLGSNVAQPPSGQTPFSGKWDPVGLLKLLKQAGIIGGAG